MAETKARFLANLIEDDGDVKSAHLDNITVSPTAVSDQANTSTGYFDFPAGTTAQRPTLDNSGGTRFNTTLGSLEFYDGNNWISTNEPTPTISSISGTIYAGTSGRSLTITGTQFNTTNISIEYLDGTSRIVIENDITPTSATSVTRTIPQSVYDKASGTTIGIRVLNAGLVASNTDTSKSVTALPSGGTESGPTGGYYYHTFNTTANFTNTISNLSVEYLVVAGGGGGSGNGWGGGGGAGGMLTGTTTLTQTSSNPYAINIGGPGGSGGNGSNTTALGFTAYGGGNGGYHSSNGASGGSGGGGGGDTSTSGGSSTSGQGNNGGGGLDPSPEYAGGGGGKGSAGVTATTSEAGDGGAGAEWPSGSGNYYAGGGGGGCGRGDLGADFGEGGSGVGGNGGVNQAHGGNNGQNPTSGTINTGGGGGGGAINTSVGNANHTTGAGSGGKGIVIIRYQLPA